MRRADRISHRLQAKSSEKSRLSKCSLHGLQGEPFYLGCCLAMCLSGSVVDLQERMARRAPLTKNREARLFVGREENSFVRASGDLARAVTPLPCDTYDF